MRPQKGEGRTKLSKADGGGARRARMTAAVGTIDILRDYAVVVTFCGLFVALAVSSSAFLTRGNLLNVLDQAAVTGIVACGGTLVIIAGGFDLSVGAIYAVSGMIAAMVANEVGVATGLVAGVASGIGFGLVNGLLATVCRITPFIATLASAIAIGGLAYALTGGFSVVVEAPSFTALGQGTLLSVKYSIWIFLAFATISGVVLSRTTFGRCILASGANAEVARLSGVRVGVVRVGTFAISGFSASLAGVIVASLLAEGQPGRGGFDLVVAAIAAIAVGGTSIMGGEGAMWRTVIGVLLLTLLTNGFNLLNIQEAYQQVVQGAIILAAVALDTGASRGRA